jgi:hypothetical protein
MIMRKNPRDQELKIHEGIGKENTSLGVNFPMHKFYSLTGKYNFGELDLFGYGWNKVYPFGEETPKLVSSVKRDGKKKIISLIEEEKESDYKKTLIYENKSELAMVAMYLDMKNDYHEIEISARKNSEENLDIIKRTKSMLENELKCKLKKRTLEKGI